MTVVRTSASLRQGYGLAGRGRTRGRGSEDIGQRGGFAVWCWMFRPISLLMIGLLAAGPLLAQTEPNKSPATKDADKPPTVKEPGKKPTEQAPPPAAGQSPATAPNPAADASAKPQIDKNPPPLDPKNMDTSVKPGDDFYLFANGAWIKNNPVPPEFSRWAAFNELAEKNNDALHEICEKAAGGNAPAATDTSKDSKKSKTTSEKPASADVQKVGDFYASGMNESAIDAAKAQPLDEEMKKIDAMKDRKDVLKEIG